MNQKVITKAEEIVESKTDGGYCSLALIDIDGYPTVSTISVSKAKGIEWVAFCTNLGSNWTKRVEKCSRASICFNSDSPSYNITLVGTIEILTDLTTKKEMWCDGMECYFNGLEDPEFCVLRFQTQRYSLMFNEEQGTARGTL